MDDNNALADLAAAWDEHEEPQSEETPAVTEAPPLEEVAPVEEAPLEDIPEEETPVAAELDAPAEGEPVEEAEMPKGDPSPISLPAAAREEWGKVPKVVQDAVIKREKDFAVGIQRYAEGSKRATAMDSVLSPYAQYFAMNNQNPAQGVQQVLSTAANLQMGSPQQRAQTVADMIGQFGVDVSMLDNLLTGQHNGAEQPQGNASQGLDPRVQEQIDSALAPYKQREQAHQQQVQQNRMQVQQEVNTTVDQFGNDPKNEFYRDVRGDMADILDMAANRGLKMSMEDAYRRACTLNPEIHNIIQSRETQRLMTSKKRAATSVTGSPGGSPSPHQGMSITDDINAAWDASGQL